MKHLAIITGFVLGAVLGTIASASKPSEPGGRSVLEDARREPAVPRPPPPENDEWQVIGYPPRGRHLVVVWEVLDGDTVEGGFVIGPVRFRIAGIDAPELNTPEGVAAKNHLTKLMPGYLFQANIQGTEKYGRTLADFWKKDRQRWISTLMVEERHAVPYHGGKR